MHCTCPLLPPRTAAGTALIFLAFIVASCSSGIRPAHRPPEHHTPPAPAIVPSSAPCALQDRKFDRAEALVLKKRFSAALAIASHIAEFPCSRDRQSKALELIGDIYMAEGKEVNAFYFFVRAGEKAGPRKDFSRILSKAVSSVAHMSADNIIFILEKTAPPRIQKALLFQSAAAKANAGNPREARALYQSFIKKFPEDTYTPAARSITADLNRRPETLTPAVGILLPLTGYYKTGGSRALGGINYYRQISGRDDLRFIIMDTASDPGQAARAVKELKIKGAACIIGPMVTARAAAEQARDLEIPMILLSQAPDIPEISPMIFRHFLFPEQQIRSSAAFIMEKYGRREFAALYPDDDYGSAFVSALKKQIPDMGGRITDIQRYSPGQTDFSPQIKSLIKGYRAKGKDGRFRDISSRPRKERNKIYRAKTDFNVLFIPDSPDTAAMIAPQLKYHGISDVILMGTNLWHTDKLLQAAAYLKNAVFTDGFHPEKEKTAEFIRQFTEETGSPPGYIQAAAYEAVSSIAPIIAESKASGRQLAEEISRVNRFSALTCTTGFDPRGEPLDSLDIFQIRGGAITLVRPCTHR
ncbi:MAG: penicillin-binding protein activator [Desulfobacter sp.]|nr:MAG: penicillin-binding protein activator [Desulfobacter sp.]